MAKLQNRQNSRGLTLIGVVVATFIVVVAIVLLSRIMATNNKATRLAQQKFIATALAREGLELVQAWRDQNWFSADNPGWTDQLCSDSGDTGNLTIDLDEFTGIFIGDDTQTSLYLTPAGQWTHNNDTANNLTPYSRLITVDCASSNPADPLTYLDYVDVTSTVTWTNQEISLKTRLFNWYVPPS
ncbi:MAG: hypothetical protein Q8P73_03595 [bacterium]|nr:hypothetical protein [bacterium]MDZ4346531.1 hypothetical protein [Candidatus Binatia bacterium]